jgi:hypothetical protein
MVFVGTLSAGSYSVVCYDDTLTLVQVNLDTSTTSISGLLTGVAQGGTDYFVATTSGIYQIKSNTVTPIVSGNIKGITCVGSSIIAITYNGTLYHFPYGSVPTPPADVPSLSLGGTYTGAICSWERDTDTLLLLGVQGEGNSTNRGYREVTLDSSGVPTSGVRTPGDGVSTVSNRAKYQSSIGKHAVYSIRQVPGNPVVFASTYKDGLWSLRNNEWNGEE